MLTRVGVIHACHATACHLWAVPARSAVAVVGVGVGVVVVVAVVAFVVVVVTSSTPT